MSSNENTASVPGQRAAGSLPLLPGIPAWVAGEDAAASIPLQPSLLGERLRAARTEG